MKQVMLDIETLGTHPGAVIIQIGAVDFSDVAELMGHGFKVNITRRSCEEFGMKATQSTINWWKDQSPEAKASVMAEPRLHVVEALEQFRAWFRSVNGQFVWGNGATFDNVLLDIAFRATRVARPWHYRGDRDMRTLVALAKMLGIEVEYERIGVKHDALDDAKTQAFWTQRVLRRMKELK